MGFFSDRRKLNKTIELLESKTKNLKEQLNESDREKS